MENAPTAEHLRRAAAEDRALLASIAARDTNALETLYDRYAPVLLAHCLRVLGDRSEAETLLLEVLREVWERAERYDPTRTSPLVYLLMLSRSRCIDRWRRLGRRASVLEGPEDLRGSAQVRDAEPGEALPSAQALAAQRRSFVRTALDRLEPPERQVVELAYFYGLTQPEIAKRLGQRLGTVKTWIQRGLIRLRDALHPLCAETNST